jgi:hypothetical protein
MSTAPVLERQIDLCRQLYLVGVSRTAGNVFRLTDTEFLLDEPEGVGLLDRFTERGAPWASRDDSIEPLRG